MIRFENYTIDSTPSGTVFMNHKTNEVVRFPAGDPTGNFFDLMDEIENQWDAQEPYSVVLDRLWAQIKN